MPIKFKGDHYKIIIGKRWDKGAVYIGRGSPLGNPYPINESQSRDMVCDAYEQWFAQQITVRNNAVMHELSRLEQILRTNGRLVLGCYCAPKRCHGETIKRYLEERIAASKDDGAVYGL